MPDKSSLIRYHRDGFARFSKIIDSSEDFAASLAVGKTYDDISAFNDSSRDIAEKRRSAVAKNLEVLQSNSLRIIWPRARGAVCYGVTRNNLREFDFLERQCAEIGLRISEDNLFRYPQILAGSDERRKGVVQALVEDVKRFYDGRDAISAPLVQQQLTYTREFLRFYLSFTAPRAVWPALMVLSNDHYPTQIALSMLMKGAGVPRMYIQHAEVTEGFPELDFEYSILRNEVSCDVYKNIGAVSGEIYIISRYAQPFASRKLETDRGGRASIVIYPSSLVAIPTLADMIDRLKANADVGKVYIKPHPNSKFAPETLKLLEGAVMTHVAPAEDHVAIVGNSSVVTEILHDGTPVYQNFGLDPIQEDYYGFVRAGLTRHVSLEGLATRFWVPYALSPEWLGSFARLDPTVLGQSDADRQRLLSSMQALLGVGKPMGSAERGRRLLRKLALRAMNVVMMGRKAVGV